MKKLQVFVFCLAALILPQSLLAQPHTFLIVPGKSIGQTKLGPHGSDYLKRLPRPAADDAGMMQNHFVWTSHAPGKTLQTLYIHTVANGALNVPPIDGVTIDEIRVTSPAFHTRNGLHTGSSLAAIHRQFPRAYQQTEEPTIYCDTQRGIAFEFAGTRCIAITVFPPGSPRTDDAATIANLLKDNQSG